MLQGDAPDVRRLFEQKKQGGCPDCPHHHPERKRLNVRKFTKKKMKILTRFAMPNAPRSNLFAGVFFYY
jgi:ubiquitin C-terminal hydrolase